MFDLLFNKKNATKRYVPPAAERPLRSLAKAVSWRVTGSVDTMLLSWFFTGNLTIAAAIGLTEVLTKMALYYLHERIWNRIPLGRAQYEEWRQKAAPGTSLEPGLRAVAESE